MLGDENLQTVIQLENVRKQYGSNVAVDGITLNVSRGEIFGIVGPNGAGKTTLIEIIEGIRTADSGVMKVLGLDIRHQSLEIKHRIGVLLQSTSIPEKAKVKEIMHLFASFYKKPANLQDINKSLGLDEKQNEYIKSLSGGWKQRVSLALALINDPEILFLDEPSMGLDPNARKDMWNVIHKLRDEGRSIVVTTHYMEEAETLCDRVAVINKGKLIALDTPKRLVSLVGGTKAISFKNNDKLIKETISTLSHVVNVEWKPDQIKLYSSNLDQTLKQLFHLADKEDWLVSDLVLDHSTMDDVFSKLTSEGEDLG